MWRLPATLLVVVTLLVDGTYQVRAAAFDDDDEDQVGLIYQRSYLSARCQLRVPRCYVGFTYWKIPQHLILVYDQCIRLTALTVSRFNKEVAKEC